MISSVNEIKNIDDPSSDEDADLTKHDEEADDFFQSGLGVMISLALMLIRQASLRRLNAK